jgi:hypothetical protein
MYTLWRWPICTKTWMFLILVNNTLSLVYAVDPVFLPRDDLQTGHCLHHKTRMFDWLMLLMMQKLLQKLQKELEHQLWNAVG